MTESDFTVQLRHDFLLLYLGNPQIPRVLEVQGPLEVQEHFHKVLRTEFYSYNNIMVLHTNDFLKW